MNHLARLPLCLLVLSLGACTAEPADLKTATQAINDTEPADEWTDPCEAEMDASMACWDALGDEPTDAELDACFDIDGALFTCWDESWPDEPIEDLCEAELEASDECWTALDENSTDADFEACFDVDQTLFECWDDTYPVDPTWPEDDVCVEEFEASDACWSSLDENSTEPDFEACVDVDEALMECLDLEIPAEAPPQ